MADAGNEGRGWCRRPAAGEADFPSTPDAYELLEEVGKGGTSTVRTWDRPGRRPLFWATPAPPVMLGLC